MVRAYKIKDATYEAMGRSASTHGRKAGAPKVKLGNIELRYIVVDGKPYYRLQDFLECFKQNIDSKYEGNMRGVPLMLIHKLVGNEGTGTLYMLKRGLFCDTSFMAYACEAARLVVNDFHGVPQFYSVNEIYDEDIVKIAKRSMPDAVVEVTHNDFRSFDFYRVIPNTLRGSGKDQDTAKVNVPFIETFGKSYDNPIVMAAKEQFERVLDETADKVHVPGLIRPTEEHPEPVVNVSSDNHPIQASIVKEETKLNQSIPNTQRLEKWLSGGETIKGLIEALLKGKKLNINITVAID